MRHRDAERGIELQDKTTFISPRIINPPTTPFSRPNICGLVRCTSDRNDCNGAAAAAATARLKLEVLTYIGAASSNGDLQMPLELRPETMNSLKT